MIFRPNARCHGEIAASDMVVFEKYGPTERFVTLYGPMMDVLQ